ncbi:TniQ family protein [Hydrogenophaga sp. OTU3427]|uniref:TniQ family protein n=1 Tax=Hydrogenophaga sp. OTU3427 TaxID=3043856 RepID=UPI00406D44CC
MFPTFPRSATIESMVIAAVQAGWFSSLREKLPGVQISKSRRLFDCCNKPALMAERVFVGVLTFDDLLLHHTLAPISLSFYGMKPAAGAEFESWLWDTPSNRVSILGYAFCPLCVEEDTLRFGCGHWRREHQIESVRICQTHRIGLWGLDECRRCRSDFYSTKRCAFLPGQRCPICRKGEGRALPLGKTISPGYQAYCELFTDALLMPIPEIGPRERRALAELPRLLCNGNIEVFSCILQSWLGNQSHFLASIVSDAMRFLYQPAVDLGRSRMIPSLILLAALKRTVYGYPANVERWAM